MPEHDAALAKGHELVIKPYKRFAGFPVHVP
jgi:hypothetical protein